MSFGKFVDTIHDPELAIALLVAIAAFATIITLMLPAIQQDKLASRLNAVANRREELKRKQREAMLAANSRKQLRHTPASWLSQFVRRVNMEELMQSPEVRIRLAQAGLRGDKHVATYLFFRFLTPLAGMTMAFVYCFMLNDMSGKMSQALMIVFAASLAGYYLPATLIQNMIQKRRQSIMKAFPDALDLMLICVEAGMSIEAAFHRVSHEVGTQSVELAEELGLTLAELSYLQDRRQAYENFALRTGHPGVKAVVTSLVQAEVYGTPLGQALRVMADENRQMRMNAAEKKAAALPAQLTVPMVLFFLPVLFVVILGPLAIEFFSHRQ